MFLLTAAGGISLGCDVCQQALSERDARLVHRTEIRGDVDAHCCILAHDACIDGDTLKKLWTDAEMAAMLQGQSLPAVAFVVLKIIRSDFEFEIDRCGHFEASGLTHQKGGA